MSTIQEHRRLAEHHEEFLSHFDLDTTKFTDWAAIVCFYAALQWIDAYLVKINKRESGHMERLERVKIELPNVYRAFWKLFQDSMNVRYDLVTLTTEHLKTNSKVRLDSIREVIIKRLAS